MHGTDLDPAPGAQHLGADYLHGDKEDDENSIGPRNPVDEPVVIDPGEDEHGDQASRYPKKLLVVEVGIHVLCVQGGGIDFQHGNGADEEYQREQAPVEVAESQEAAHQNSLSCQRSGTPVSQMGRLAWEIATVFADTAGSTKKWPDRKSVV